MVEQQGSDGSQLVILYHASSACIHWDILIRVRQAPELLAWRCLIDPAAWFLKSHKLDLAVIQLAAHRLKYLNFTGLVSGDRGWVRPVLTAFAHTNYCTEREVEIVTSVCHPRLRIMLEKSTSTLWLMRAAQMT